ncbi:glycosyltransferase [Mycobacterium intracellulare]|uniref:Glycosyltransferase n=1 Tax=Mycobacterium intracellulare TaxID=1767 RepID=A0AAE4UDU2_MYCIT|nr:glycosyltransferase [Mycobacterium intracellulare]MCA2322082.1 glycosyltransferase [Mycobacterium intracellulare]MCA2342402.1 glycosyltransferase [Mycobacterium intracellulare]MDV6978754.1 glycosyltransferase [Mycobacterium intracellulare]MDV6984060.1 glycosyltransferase [Mycobacterium intracellulare]MDV7015072.1 glycosyltransferase [Mycobacterium intracellulare]
MRFVLASYGTRGDIEPSLVVGRELQRRGHDVCIAVPPDLVGFAESAGLTAVPYGAETQAWLDMFRNFFTSRFSTFRKIREKLRWARELWEISTQAWVQMNETLKSLAEGADLVLAGQTYQEIAANVAEYHGLPLAALHHVPIRPNGQVVAILPAPASRLALMLHDWLWWRAIKNVENSQRRDLGLPRATCGSPRRIAERGSLEIQAYDEVAFPGLAAEWAKWRHQRPFVGALTMELATGADDEAASWIAAGTPPIFFGFGSMPVESPSDTIEMISGACAQLGERALICAGWSDFDDVPHSDHVKVVGALNYASIFPLCRAAVHHGGSGTTAASLRAGIPTLVLSVDGNQIIWGAQVKRRLKVGTHRRLSATTRESLVADLRRILTPEYAIRARDLAARMTTPAESVAKAADLAENFAGSRRSA